MTAPQPPRRFRRPVVGRTCRALGVLRPEDRPVGYPIDVRDVRMARGETLPARGSGNGAFRWCLCCDTVLGPRGRSPLCDAHRAEHRVLRRQRHALARRQNIPVPRVALGHVHDLGDLIERDLGGLTIAYNTGRDLRQEMNRAMLDAERLIAYLRANVFDPRDRT